MHFTVPVLTLEYFRIVTHTYAMPFSIITCFYETKNISYLENWTKLHKSITASKSAMKTKVMLRSTLPEILLMSAVICKQKHLHEIEIVQSI